MTKSVREVLLGAADLLNEPGAWTQGEAARDAGGKVVPPLSRLAVCWCTIGAIWKVGGRTGDHPAEDAFRNFLNIGTIGGWNDASDRRQTEVVAVLRAAAAAQVSA